MKYLIEVERITRGKVVIEVTAENPEAATVQIVTTDRLITRSPHWFEYLEPNHMATDRVLSVELVDDVPDRPEAHAAIPTVELKSDDPRILLFESLDHKIPTPNSPKKIKKGKGKTATCEERDPDPMKIETALEHDGKLWMYNGGSWQSCDDGSQIVEYFFVRLIPRDQYDGRVKVRTHQHDYRYHTKTGLLVIYQGQEYVIDDREHFAFAVTIRPDPDPEPADQPTVGRKPERKNENGK